jgi:hypothetical protein
MRYWLWYEVVKYRGLSKDGLAWNPVYRLGLWMVWKDISCMDWDGGWIGKLLGVWLGLWKVLLKSAKDRF